MKKNNILKYTCLTIISFLSFAGIIKAATTNPIGPGERRTIPSLMRTNFKCENVTSDGFSITKNGDDYIVSYDGSAGAGKTKTINCEFDGYMGIGDNMEKQTIPFVFITTASSNDTINVDPETGATTIPGINNAIIVEVSSSSEYIDTTGCAVNTSTCVIKASSQAMNQANRGGMVRGTVIVKYRIDGTDTYITREISVNISTRRESIAKAYPGGVGVCSFDTNYWENAEWTNSGGQTYYPMKAYEGAVLPNCVVQNSVIPVTFKGWVSAPNSNNSVLHAVGECSGAVSPNTPVSSGGYTNYYACYEADPFIQLAVDEGNISDLDNWEYQSGRGYMYINKNHATQATLPDVKLIGAYNADRTFDGWFNRATGQTKNAGDTVDLDGSVWEAQYSRTVTDRDYRGAVYVNKTSFKRVANFSNCSSTSDKVKAESIGGECQVTGITPTDEGETVDVLVQLSTGSTLTYKYTVYSADGQNGGDDFVIDTSENVVYDMEVLETAHNQIEFLNGGFGISHCSAYSVANVDSYRWDESSNTSGNIRYNIGGATVYSVTPGGDCTGGATFYALCLDPGRVGPGPKPGSYLDNPVTYKTTTELTKDSNLYKLVHYMYESPDFEMNRFGEVGYEGRIAAQVLTRLVGIKDNYAANDVGYSDLNRHHTNYMNAYNKWTSEGPAAAVAYLGLNNTAKSAKVQAVGALVLKGLSEYASTTVVEGEGANSLGIEKSVDNVEAEAINGGSGYIIRYKGTISLPNTVSNPQLTACGSNSFNVTCSVISWTQSGTAGTSGLEVWDYEVSYTINNASTFKIPETDEDKYQLAFSLTLGGQSEVANVYVLSQYAHGYNMQRMIAFDVNGTSSGLKVYWDIIAAPNKGNVCETVDAINPAKTCQTADNCSGFNEELFKASGCCDFIDDEVTYEHVITGVCSSDCAVSTLPQVCRVNTSSPNPDAADLYVIREGSKRTSTNDMDPQIKNQIGTCIVNTSEEYYNENRSTTVKANFLKTDDIGNKINVDSYATNKYCQVTCKEDWSISMDSFGNYVGVNAVAAGSYFSILNDIFIGGKRTCYTTYLDYDKYMNDLEKLSEKIVEQYNIYSTNSHQYSNFDQQTDSNRVNYTEATGCAVWEQCPSGFTWSGGKCQKEVTATDTVTTNPGSPAVPANPATGAPGSPGTPTTYTHSFSCTDPSVSTPYSSSDLSHTTPSSYTDSNSSTDTSKKCTYSAELKCKTKGKAYSYTLDTKSDLVENEKYTKYTTEEKVKKTTVFSTTEIATQREITNTDTNASYYRKDKITCTIDENKGPGNLGKVTCSYGNVSKNGDGTVGISGSVSSSTLCTSHAPGNNAFCQDSSSSYNKPEAFKDIKDKVKDATQQKANSAKNLAEFTYYKQFYDNVNDFFDCQHFELYNTTDDANGKKNNTLQTEVIVGSTDHNKFVEIKTAFDPDVSYTYDETAFMTILGQDNVLVENDEKNNSIMSDYKNQTNTKTEAQITFVDDEKKLGYYDEKVNLARNYLEYYYYNPSTLWTKTGTPDAFADYDDGSTDAKSENHAKLITDAPSTESKYVVLCTVGSDHNDYHFEDNDNTSKKYKFTGSVNGTTWNNGSCYKVKVSYKKARYISASIENSSFYKNKGSWFVRGGDIKEHGEDLDDAISKANARGASYPNSREEKNHWSVFGAEKDNYYSYNTFPISLDTPRNLYQYTYWFADIGSFSDGKLGRIMGNKEAGGKSVIKLNNRTCFYEVYEEICLCCGSEVTTYTEGAITITEDFLNDGSKNGGYSYNLANDADVSKSNQGRLNINSSSISLTDVNSIYGSTSRDIPSNWSDKSPFFYGGTTYYTSKGEVAKKEIEALGENAYAAKAEYSYHLTPATMIAIKEYNNGVGYEINYSRLKVYGRVPLQSLGGSNAWTASDDDLDNKYPNFQHYGSIFLEDYMTDLNAVYSDTITKLKGADNVCYASDETELKTQINSGSCRWIDYVETTGGKTFRLAFK